MKKNNKNNLQEKIFVPFVHSPESGNGVTLNFPENLYRPFAETRKVFRIIAENGGDEIFEAVESWIVIEIKTKKDDTKALEKLESRRRLWEKVTGRAVELETDAETDAVDNVKANSKPDAAPETDADAETETDAGEMKNNKNNKNNKSRKAERGNNMKNNHFDFFANCKSADEVKNRYYQLAKIYHPDTGTGDEETMKVINDQYSAYFGRSAAAENDNPELPADVIALPEHCETPAAVDEAAEYIDVIAALVVLPGITCEICGSWLWISGDTKSVKDAIKAAGCRFSGNKKMWYWRPESQNDGNRRYRGGKSIGYIRGKYGSTRIFGDDTASA